MLLIASSVKLVAEIALLSLLGQWLLGILAARQRDSNFFVRLFQVLTRPFMRLTRWITPRVVLDRHIALAAFVLLAMLWLMATAVKIELCMQVGVDACR